MKPNDIHKHHPRPRRTSAYKSLFPAQLTRFGGKTFMRLTICFSLALFLATASTAQTDQFDRLYEGMLADQQAIEREKTENLKRRASSIIQACRELIFLPSRWKEDFSRRYRVNVRSIMFLGTYWTNSSYPSCFLKTSSDRGVCRHKVYLGIREPIRISSIDTTCR